MFDNRYDDSALEIASASNIMELTSLYHAHKNMDWRTAILYANKRYSLLHEVPLYISNNVSLVPPGRHTAWAKVAFIHSLQQANLTCEWFFWLDSDAYLWMSKQTISLHAFKAHGSIHEFTEGYVHAEASRMSNKDPWAGYEFVIGLNGFEMPGREYGFPRAFGQGAEFICSGTFMVRNSPMGFQIMSDWLSHQGYETQFPWEQGVLGTAVFPRFKQLMILYSYLIFGWESSTAIRHIWTALREKPENVRELLSNVDSLFGVQVSNGDVKSRALLR